jgi:pimeloyl-ACP methyl ester carboxylesterase
MWREKAKQVGVLTEREFELSVEGRLVPGVVWSDGELEPGQPIVLLGHGGTTHKRADYLVQVAMLLGRRGVVSMAIDGPGHGERGGEPDPEDPGWFEKAWNEGGGTDAVVADWRAALDFVGEELETGKTGYWGLSMGTMMGLPVVANDDRIAVALLGLMGNWGPNADRLMAEAPNLACPVRFLMQWDDEVVPRDTCLELFSTIGSERKTLHANPGLHSAVPAFEIRDSTDYLAGMLKRRG